MRARIKTKLIHKTCLVCIGGIWTLTLYSLTRMPLHFYWDLKATHNHIELASNNRMLLFLLLLLQDLLQGSLWLPCRLDICQCQASYHTGSLSAVSIAPWFSPRQPHLPCSHTGKQPFLAQIAPLCPGLPRTQHGVVFTSPASSSKSHSFDPSSSSSRDPSKISIILSYLQLFSLDPGAANRAGSSPE